MSAESPFRRFDPGRVRFLEGQLGYQLRRASAVMLADLAQTLEDLGLRIPEASLLTVIRDQPGSTQSELGRVLGMQRPNVAPLVAAFEERGLIERSPADGRSHGLRLTASGEALADEVRHRMIEHEARMLPLSPQEKQFLLELLPRIWSQTRSRPEEAHGGEETRT